MPIGVVGRKCGMTRIFTEEGASVPVTVIEVTPNRVTLVRSLDRDGYAALQVTTGSRRANRVAKPLAGHYRKGGVGPGRGLWEFRVRPEELEGVEVGHEITVAAFAAGQKVDVSATSVGKGYAGVIKRHRFSRQDMSHGNSLAHRAPGSIGQNQTPGRVFKGKRMAGHMGNVRRTVQNLEVVRVDEARGIVLVKGSVPGAAGGNVLLRPAVRSRAIEKVA